MADAQPFARLFSPLTVKGMEVKNRVVMLPHLPLYATYDHRPTSREAAYYGERARGGVGLIVHPSLGVHPSGSYTNTADAFVRDNIPGFRQVADAVHRFDAKLIGQLTHMGNQDYSVETLQPLWAPSAVPDMTVREIPKAMTLEDIAVLVASFAASAANLVEAGYDGIEIKVAHDGVLRQFLSPAKNKRTDQYGGDRAGRSRVVVEVMQAIRQAIGDRPLGVRLCLNEFIPDGYDWDEGIVFGELLAPHADYISADTGTWESMPMAIPPVPFPQGQFLENIARLKNAIDIPVIGAVRLLRPEMAEQALADDVCDLIGMARGLIADPYWAEKARSGASGDIISCIGCNEKCVGRLLANLPISCVVNPASGHEETYGAEKLFAKASQPRKVVVVGGGPAGMKTAEIVARRGHHVVLFEQAAELGGRARFEGGLPNREEFAAVATNLSHLVHKLGVDVRTGVAADAKAVLAEQPDVVVIATGASPVPQEGTFSLQDILDEKVTGKTVLLLDMEAHLEGAGALETLLAQGKTVHWVSPVFADGQDLDVTSLLTLYQRIGGQSVTMHAMSVMIGMQEGTATLLNLYTNQTEQVSDIDAVVSIGTKTANAGLYDQVKAQAKETYVIGDAAAPRRTSHALSDAMTLSATI